MVDINKINHADIPGFLRSQGAIGQGVYDKLLAHGHKKADLDAVIKGTGITIGPKLQSSNPGLKRSSPAPTTQRQIDYSSPISFDGKDFQYRNPSNTRYISTDRGDKETENPNAQGFLNPLYNYSQGQVEDAARYLNISNVNRQSEVDAILNYIRNPTYTTIPAPAPVEQAPVQESIPIEPQPLVEAAPDPYADFASLLGEFTSSLTQALRPQPVQPPPEPTTYASAGQAARSVPGVKIRRSKAAESGMNTLGTSGAFNRGALRITNLNV